MSDIHENIATLTGTLRFIADSSGLAAFQNMLRRVQTQMTSLGKQADKLQKQLSIKLGVKASSSTSKQLERDAKAAEIRQQRAAVAAEKARRDVMRTDLMQRKLTLADQREQAFLTSAQLRHKQLSAVAAAKEYKAQAEQMKLGNIAIKQEATLAASKARQAAAEERLSQAKARSAIAAQKQLQSLTATQRAELALMQARERGQRAAKKFTDSQVASKLRSQRQDIAHEHKQLRFVWAQQRQAAWEVRQNRPEPSSGLFGMGAIGTAATGIGAALLGVTEALSYAAERINKRQEQTADTQLFDNTLLAAGNTDAERERIRKAYIENSQEYGMKIDRDSATQYSNQVQGFRAQGKTLDQAIQLQKEQAQVFRIGALNQQQQYSAALQLGQGYSKDRFMGSDLRPLTDALGTRLTTILYKAIGKSLGYKGNQDQLAGFVLQAQHDGKVNGAMVQQGLRDIVAQSGELLERHSHSLDAQAVRVENEKYLQSDSINQSPELIQALGERLTAERQLIDSAKGLNTALMNLDVGLAKMQTGFFNMLAGKNADNTYKSDVQRASEIGAGGTIEGYGIDPSALSGAKVDSYIKPVKDPVDNLWRKLFKLPNYQDGEANKVLDQGELHFNGDLSARPLDLSQFQLPEIGDGLLHQVMRNLPKPITADDVLRANESRRGSGKDTTVNAEPASTVITNSNNTTNVQPANVTVNITAPEGADAKEIATLVKSGVRDELQSVFGEYQMKEVK